MEVLSPVPLSILHVIANLTFKQSLLLLLFSRSVMSELCDPMDYSTPGFPVLHYLPEFAQTHLH